MSLIEEIDQVYKLPIYKSSVSFTTLPVQPGLNKISHCLARSKKVNSVCAYATRNH